MNRHTLLFDGLFRSSSKALKKLPGFAVFSESFILTKVFDEFKLSASPFEWITVLKCSKFCQPKRIGSAGQDRDLSGD